MGCCGSCGGQDNDQATEQDKDQKGQEQNKATEENSDKGSDKK